MRNANLNTILSSLYIHSSKLNLFFNDFFSKFAFSFDLKNEQEKFLFGSKNKNKSARNNKAEHK